MTITPTKARPTHHVFVVEGQGDKAFWTKIGAAWSHGDGDGLNVTLTATPLDGKMVIRTIKTTATEPDEDAQQ